MSKDKMRVEIVPGAKPEFIFSEKSLNPPFAQITCACVVPFTKDGRLVATILQRGMDIPGGHVQENETSIEQTVRREAFEEAAISLSTLHVLGYLHDKERQVSKDDITYIACTAAFVEEIFPFRPSPESLGREIVDKEEFLLRYQAGDQKCMQTLVENAQALLFGQAGK